MRLRYSSSIKTHSVLSGKSLEDYYGEFKGMLNEVNQHLVNNDIEVLKKRFENCMGVSFLWVLTRLKPLWTTSSSKGGSFSSKYSLMTIRSY